MRLPWRAGFDPEKISYDHGFHGWERCTGWRRIIRALAGTTHELWTGVCLWVRPGDWQLCWQELSRVSMRELADAEIETYIATRKWEGCSGAYAIEFPHDPILTVIEGSTSNVIGLPMESLGRALTFLEGLR